MDTLDIIICRAGRLLAGLIILAASSLGVTALLSAANATGIFHGVSWWHKEEAVLGVMLLIWGIGTGITSTRPEKQELS